MNRRHFVKLSACALAGLGLGTGRAWSLPSASMRPELSRRTFSSAAVESLIARVKPRIGDDEIAWMFENCYPNTLDTTIRQGTLDGRPDTFVITGDIDAMWLRDSSAQVWPYLSLAQGDPALCQMYRGLIARQAHCVLLDPYANAFFPKPIEGEHKSGDTLVPPGVFERKYELDSLCYVMRLAHGYWTATRDPQPFDEKWRDSVKLMLETMRVQQRKHGPGPYRFDHRDNSPTETIYRGFGFPTKAVGLIHTAFRPSDDAGIYSFLLPANHFAVVALRQVAVVLKETVKDIQLARQALSLAAEVKAALAAYGLATHRDFGQIYAYEADGLGSTTFMDDANAPSLLSLPYLGCCPPSEPLYRRTRAYIHSLANPYYFRGRVGDGVGSPHTGLGRFWPLAVVMRALTSLDDHEIRHCLAILKRSHAGTGFMHEAVDVNQATAFSRPWFSWANSLFGELIVKLSQQRPHLLG